MTSTPLFSCQHDECAAEVSYEADMLRMWDGRPICQTCYEAAGYEEPLWTDLPPFIFWTVKTLQERAFNWALRCFGKKTVWNHKERAMRVLEEALELGQAGGLSREDALSVLNYVYARPTEKDIRVEFGGAGVTLLVMASAYGYPLDEIINAELTRCEQRIDKIRAKQHLKPESVCGDI